MMMAKEVEDRWKAGDEVEVEPEHKWHQSGRSIPLWKAGFVPLDVEPLLERFGRNGSANVTSVYYQIRSFPDRRQHELIVYDRGVFLRVLLLKLPLVGKAILMPTGKLWIKSHFRKKLAPNVLPAAWVAMTETNEDIQEWLKRNG